MNDSAAAEPIASTPVDSPASDEEGTSPRSRIARLREGGLIDLRWLLIVWLKWSWLIVLAGVPAAYSGYKQVRAFVPEYTARMVVTPTGGDSQGQASAARGVASQLGLNVGGPVANEDFNRFKVLLGSPQLAQSLQDRHGLMQIVFAGGWDEESKTWKRPTGEDFERQQKIRAHFNLPTWTPPSIYSLASYIAATVDIDSEEDSGFFELRVTHRDPKFAVWLLDTAYRSADALLRENKKAEITQQRRYITEQLAEQTSLDIRGTLLNLLASVERKDMALQSASLISSQVLIAPYLMPGQTAPNITLLIYAPALGSMAVAMALITVIALFRSE